MIYSNNRRTTARLFEDLLLCNHFALIQGHSQLQASDFSSRSLPTMRSKDLIKRRIDAERKSDLFWYHASGDMHEMRTSIRMPDSRCSMRANAMSVLCSLSKRSSRAAKIYYSMSSFAHAKTMEFNQFRIGACCTKQWNYNFKMLFITCLTKASNCIKKTKHASIESIRCA